MSRELQDTPHIQRAFYRTRTDCQVLLSTGFVLFPSESTVSSFLLRRSVIHRLDFVRFVWIACFREVREERENRLGDALILTGIVSGEEKSSGYQRQTEDVRYILSPYAAETLKQNRVVFFIKLFARLAIKISLLQSRQHGFASIILIANRSANRSDRGRFCLCSASGSKCKSP